MPVGLMSMGQRFTLEKAFIIQEKGFIIAKAYQINKGEKFEHFASSPKNGPPAFGNSLFDCCRHVGK